MPLTSEFDRLTVWCLFFLFLVSCSPPERAPGDLRHVPYRPMAYKVEEPPRFVKMTIPEDNPLTREGVALGRQLFFDPILSVDSTISCAGCHQPGRAFTDGRKLSLGVNGRQGLRNAPSLINVAYLDRGLFWDGRVARLEDLVEHPILDTLEMANDWSVLLLRLQEHKDYPERFRRAFGIGNTREIDPALTARALAQFLRTLISGNTLYDQYKAGQMPLTPSQDRGRRIFFDIEDGLPAAECGHCHVEPLFSGLQYFNNGLDEAFTPSAFPDPGRGAVTGRVGEVGAFRTPGLRNVAVTAPYMHDGRFETLEEVIEHYAAGGHYSEYVNPNIRKLDLSAEDKADLIAFLHTLTDPDLEPIADNQE